MLARRPLTAAEQHLALRTGPASPGEGALSAGRLVWRFPVRPGPLGRDYVARLDYRQGDFPQVYVEDPDLVGLAAGRRLPHVYRERPVELCLWLPGAFEWTADKRLDRTVVPWTALWLHYFEEWLWSGDWKGGGAHPSERARRRSRRRARVPS